MQPILVLVSYIVKDHACPIGQYRSDQDRNERGQRLKTTDGDH
jgi:hypothetical protein